MLFLFVAFLPVVELLHLAVVLENYFVVDLIVDADLFAVLSPIRLRLILRVRITPQALNIFLSLLDQQQIRCHLYEQVIVYHFRYNQNHIYHYFTTHLNS